MVQSADLMGVAPFRLITETEIRVRVGEPLEPGQTVSGVWTFGLPAKGIGMLDMDTT